MIFTLFFLCIAQSSYALEARWLGVSGILLKDEQTTLLIDPVFTKPDLSHWILNKPFSANREKVKATLLNLQIERVDGIFISHCHFDHASDVGYISSYLKAPVYGGSSLEKIVYYVDPSAPFIHAEDKSEIEIGLFKIKMFRRPHPAIIRPINWHFLGGTIDQFNGNFYDYREGEVWMFIIEHPQGVTIFDQSSVFFEESRQYAGKVNNYFLGVSNPENKKTLVENNIKILEPKRVIPIHHDFFFLESETLSLWNLPTVNFEHIQSEIKRLNLKTQFIIPIQNQVIKLNQEL
jgi:L-ascorbate metabolism protein UlaG (beta-lactamase superfamily)